MMTMFMTHDNQDDGDDDQDDDDVDIEDDEDEIIGRLIIKMTSKDLMMDNAD